MFILSDGMACLSCPLWVQNILVDTVLFISISEDV